MFFTSLDFTFTTRHCHSWVSFSFWSSHFILSGVIIIIIVLSISPVAYWTFSDLGGLIFQCNIVLPFHTVHGVLTERILEWFAICCPRGPHFIRTLQYDPSILGGHTWHGSQLHWVMQAPLPQQGCDPWRGKKVNWLSEKPLQITEERRDMKGKGERERYTQLNAEFQRIARRDKNAFLKEQYKN